MATPEEDVGKFARRGYCAIPQVLNDDMLQSLLKRFGDSGALITADYHDPVMVKRLTWPKTLEMLATLGFTDPRLHSFYVTTKPPKAGPLAWHSDLFYRYEQPEPAEIFLIYYLQDTNRENGCLRVVPGSHMWSHDNRHEQPENASVRSDEVDVIVKAGDLFVGNRRILHATHYEHK